MGHMEFNRKKVAVLFALLLGSQLCIAQTGYNYPRPEVPLGNSAPAIPSTSSGSSVRPVVGFPTAATAAGFSPSPGYGGTVGPTSPSFGFTTPQRTGSAFGSTGTAFGSSRASSDITTTGFPNTSGIGKRPTIPPRSSGIYGSGSTGLGSQQQQQQQFSSGGDQFEGDYSAIPGEPGVNYPVYAEVPPTSFDCNQQQYPGYYSNVEAQCQVFHICALNRTYSFLCPNGTIFSQETLVCVWWNMFDCASAPGLYANNAFIYDYLQPTEARPSTGGSYSGGGLASSSRAQSGFQGSGRTTGSGGGGVFSGNVRPTVPNASFGGVTSGVNPVGTTAFPSGSTGTGRYSSAGSAPTGGAFPTGPPATAPAFGTTIRTGFSPIQDATFPSPQVSPTTSNREYLPPRRP